MRDDSDDGQPLMEDLEGPTPDSQSRHEVAPLIERDQDRSNRHRCPRTHEGWRLPFSTRYYPVRCKLRPRLNLQQKVLKTKFGVIVPNSVSETVQK